MLQEHSRRATEMFDYMTDINFELSCTSFELLVAANLAFAERWLPCGHRRD